MHKCSREIWASKGSFWYKGGLWVHVGFWEGPFRGGGGQSLKITFWSAWGSGDVGLATDRCKGCEESSCE